jgi:hypothetical protein
MRDRLRLRLRLLVLPGREGTACSDGYALLRLLRW